MVIDLSRLSAEQRAAVLAGDGPVLIVAGPGSGKTTVLAARIAYLVASRRVPPSSILAITFATKATRELKSRLGGMLGEGARAVDVATFHAFGLRIVRQWSEELGLGPGPLAVYGREEARRLLEEAARLCGFELGQWALPELTARLEALRLGHRADLPGCDELAALMECYESLLSRRGALDYPAMLSLPLRLFSERPEALRLYQDAYRHVLSDEFQDVSVAQYAVLRLLAERHRNLVVVGDPRQTLYGWRGADVRFLLEFQRDFPEARLLSLDQNFRSTANIVELANVLGRPLGPFRPLWTDNPRGQVALLHTAEDEEAEADFVAEETGRLLVARQVDHPGQVAVLYRTNSQAEVLALALRRRALPYRVLGRGDLFSRREVRDILFYLRLAHNPADSSALARIANVPPRGLATLARQLQAEPVPLQHLPNLARSFGRSAGRAASGLVELIDELHHQSTALPPAVLLDLAVERSGYGEWLSRQADGPTRLAHLERLRELAGPAEGDLGSWLSELQVGDAAPAPEDARRVQLTTIHGAKGGEWRVVFVVGVEEGLLPHSRALLIREGEAPVVEEELRVAYVAVTRPRERLYLTCCRGRRLGERREARRPSRFLQALPAGLLRRAA